MYISKILNVSVMFDYVLIKKQEKKSYTWTFNDTIHIFLRFAFYAIYATRSTPRALRHAFYATLTTRQNFYKINIPQSGWAENNHYDIQHSDTRQKDETIIH